MAAKPYSLRVDDDTLRRLNEEAAHYRVAPRTLAQEILEEGVRMRRHPGIAFVERAGGRMPALSHRPRLRIHDIVRTVRASSNLKEAADYLDLTLTDLEKAMRYYAEFRAQIDAEIQEMDEEAERAEREFWEAKSLARPEDADAAPPR
ncbi:MAG: hypothetical protein ACRDGE_02715 [Candidatus Limnocylindria bacterium]